MLPVAQLGCLGCAQCVLLARARVDGVSRVGMLARRVGHSGCVHSVLRCLLRRVV